MSGIYQYIHRPWLAPRQEQDVKSRLAAPLERRLLHRVVPRPDIRRCGADRDFTYVGNTFFRDAFN